MPTAKYRRFPNLPRRQVWKLHCLRHAFATRLKKAGKTEEDIGTLLGHRDTKTTEGYVHD